MNSPTFTNILLVVVSVVGGLMAYIFNDHKNMPWHGTVGTELVKLQGEIEAAHKDIERIMRALDLDDGGGGK